MEFCHFSRVNETSPILAVGLDDVGYRVFEAGSFDSRMMLVSRGGFSIGTRCNLRKLRMNLSSPDDQLRDVTTVLLGDLRYFLKPGVSGIGRVKDYPSTMPLDVVATELLQQKLQPKLVAQWTGLNADEVVRMKRSLLRDTPLSSPKAGAYRHRIRHWLKALFTACSTSLCTGCSPTILFGGRMLARWLRLIVSMWSCVKRLASRPAI